VQPFLGDERHHPFSILSRRPNSLKSRLQSGILTKLNRAGTKYVEPAVPPAAEPPQASRLLRAAHPPCHKTRGVERFNRGEYFGLIAPGFSFAPIQQIRRCLSLIRRISQPVLGSGNSRVRGRRTLPAREGRERVWFNEGAQDRFRSKRQPLKRFKGLLPESQGQSLTLTVLYVPYSLDIGVWTTYTAGYEGSFSG